MTVVVFSIVMFLLAITPLTIAAGMNLVEDRRLRRLRAKPDYARIWRLEEDLGFTHTVERPAGRLTSLLDTELRYDRVFHPGQIASGVQPPRYKRRMMGDGYPPVNFISTGQRWEAAPPPVQEGDPFALDEKLIGSEPRLSRIKPPPGPDRRILKLGISPPLGYSFKEVTRALQVLHEGGCSREERERMQMYYRPDPGMDNWHRR